MQLHNREFRMLQNVRLKQSMRALFSTRRKITPYHKGYWCSLLYDVCHASSNKKSRRSVGCFTRGICFSFASNELTKPHLTCYVKTAHIQCISVSAVAVFCSKIDVHLTSPKNRQSITSTKHKTQLSSVSTVLLLFNISVPFLNANYFVRDDSLRDNCTFNRNSIKPFLTCKTRH